MATTTSVDTAITTALGSSGTQSNLPSIIRNDNTASNIFLTGVIDGTIISNGSTARRSLYMDSTLFHNPSSNMLTLEGGRFNGTTNFHMMVDSSVRMTVNSNGYVGVGTQTPDCPLHVASSSSLNTNVGTARFYAYDATGSTTGGTTCSISIITDHGIWIKGTNTSGRLWLTSDQRMKTNIVNLNADKTMNIFRTLRPISFDYIDNMKNSNKKQLGFIAQEVNEVLPEGITLNSDVIPNNMIKGGITKPSVTDEEPNFILKPDDIDITLQYLLLTTDSPLKFDTANPYSSTNVYKFKVYCGEKWTKEQDIYIRSEYNVIYDKYTYVIGMKNETYDIAMMEPTLFVYGQYVYDLHILDHDTIYTVATAALKEVDRQQQADKARIAELEATVAAQQSLINDILERLKKIGA